MEFTKFDSIFLNGAAKREETIFLLERIGKITFTFLKSAQTGIKVGPYKKSWVKTFF